MSDVRPFDLLGPLPDGTTVLEASAGTGKTFTIAGLVARFVAEGHVRLDELLVVTFGRLATQELRDRVRERLVSARDGLADPGAARAGDDALLALLATGADDVIAARRRRIGDALASFDSATVATTHEFCLQVLHGLGTVGDVDAAAVLVEDLDDLTVEVVQDLYLRMWSRENAGAPPLGYDAAVELAQTVVRDGQAHLTPESAERDSAPDLRVRFAQAVRDEVERRKRARYLLSFDDVLTRLRATLASPRSGTAAAGRLRARYRVVLVDEFQDTDPVQWDILRLAFHGHATLVLIGDPKQAIYAFRGADVNAYLAAAEVADHHATLAQNWRSDPDLLRGLDAVFRGAALGDDRIVVHPVSAGHAGRSLAVPGAPVRLRAVRGAPDTRVGDARSVVIDDLVREIVGLLDSGVLLSPRDGSPPRPVQPGDLAVITRTGMQLDLVHTALVEAGVPSVQRTTSSVFRTPAAANWRVLLEALEQPRPARVRRLAVTPFVGWDAEALLTRDLDELTLRVRRWAAIVEERGIAALFETVSRDQQLPSRLLAEREGERRMTDLRHVGEALHGAVVAGQLGLTAGLEWLRRRIEEAAADSTTERSRRLDSDAAAVQVVTVHASKGLEFPVVYVPFGWDRHVRDVDLPLFHDPAGRRVRNVGGRSTPGFGLDERRHKTEEFGEDLRLLYVALTRAQSQVTAWWAPGRNAVCSPLHRLLFADDPAREVRESVPVPTETAAMNRLAGHALAGALSVTEIEPLPPLTWTGAAVPTGELTAARLGRSVDAQWRRTSYSALTRGAHEVVPAIGSEAEIGEKDDEPDTPAPPGTADDRLQAEASPMAELPGGTAFGTLVHAVLEHLNPTSPTLEHDLRALVGGQLARSGPAGVDADALTAALLPSIRTPMGRLAGGLALADIAPADRLTELDFELPLCGGDVPRGKAMVRDLAQILRDELAGDDPMAPYAELLDDPVVGDAVLRGYLGGSIDAVLRVDGRYLVVDYKTNRLGSPERPLTAWDYRAEAMAEAMMHAHYPLQALLYEVALHRFLRWRIPGYDPEQHLGGVLYLFLRGMCGPGVVTAGGEVPGVFAWRPPAGLVVAASDLLAHGVGA